MPALKTLIKQYMKYRPFSIKNKKNKWTLLLIYPKKHLEVRKTEINRYTIKFLTIF